MHRVIGDPLQRTPGRARSNGVQLLAPRSRAGQRVWRVGKGAPREPADPGELRLATRPGEAASFATLEAVLTQLAGFANPAQVLQIEKLRGYLRDVSPGAAGDPQASHGRLLSDSVAFAVMRRISRESFYTSRVIDLAAQLMNEILAGVPGCRRVSVEEVERLDRPSLKALARAVLLLTPAQGFSWIWTSAVDPRQTPDGADADLYALSRCALLRQLATLLDPGFERAGEVLARLPRPPALASSTWEVSAALVLQNYDACFLGTEGAAGRGADGAHGADSAEYLRLAALAAVNVGCGDEALRLLGEAEERTAGAARRAHLCYLQGLIETKRCYDLAESTAHYRRGLGALEQAAGEAADLALEEGWLLNGLALNEAVEWRRNGRSPAQFDRAFALEQQAFQQVSAGNDPARVYLRFNLLANTAFLLEMNESYELAAQFLSRAFDFGLDEFPGRRDRWQSTLGYRIGVLHFRAGDLDTAARQLYEAAERDAATESWATQERILRAIGCLELARGAFRPAAASFARGLEICRQGRAAQGTLEHARGLLTALHLGGEKPRAREVVRQLAEEEGLDGLATDRIDALRPSPPAPKLPAYIPEIDLEDIPAVDLNRFLGKAPSHTAAAEAPWRT